MSNSAILVINEDPTASNYPAYLETFPEPGNEACQSLGFPHSDKVTLRDLEMGRVELVYTGAESYPHTNMGATPKSDVCKKMD